MKNIRQINYWTLGGFEGAKPVAQALEEAGRMGYDGVELCFGAGVFAPGIREPECRAIRKAAAAAGVTVATLATGTYCGCSLASPRAAERRQAIAFTREYLQVAKWVGAKTVLVIPGAVAVPWDPSRPLVPYGAVGKHAAASIKACLPLARTLGVTMALENVWNWFLADPIAMRTFVDQFRSPRVKVYFDVANCLLNGAPEHWIEILGTRIAAIHFKNFTRQDCAGGLHGFGDDILKGDVDWKAVNRALRAVRYAGPITFEMIPFSRLPNLVLPDMKLARDTAKKMKRVFAA